MKETVKKEVKTPKVVDTYEAKIKKEKKDSKFKRWFNNLTLEQIIVGGVIMFYDKDDNGNKATIKYVSMNEIQKIMDKEINYIILDVRTIEEYNEGHIPNAICIPNEAIDKNVY